MGLIQKSNIGELHDRVSQPEKCPSLGSPRKSDHGVTQMDMSRSGGGRVRRSF